MELVVALKEEFGEELHCINLPKDYGRGVLDCFEQDGGRSEFGDVFGGVRGIHREMVESVVEIDEGEMEKYLSGGEVGLAELRSCVVRSMRAGKVVPVLFAAAKTEVGVDDLLHVLVNDVPSAKEGKGKRLRKKGGEGAEIGSDVEGSFWGRCLR